MTNKNQTDTLNLAAYFSLLGYQCVSIKYSQDESKFFFIFDISDGDFVSYSDLFWSRKTSVDAFSYAEELKAIKSRMYHYKNQERNYERTSSF